MEPDPPTLLVVTYEHQHECSRQGQTLEVRPECIDGAALLVHPVCIELGVELTELGRLQA